jgi:hypothetical protein
MFIRFSYRSRAYRQPGREEQEPHRTVIVQIVESRALTAKYQHRIGAHLGTCREPIDRVGGTIIL